MENLRVGRLRREEQAISENPKIGGSWWGRNGPRGKEQGSRSRQRTKSGRTKRSIDALKNKNEEIMKTDERHRAKSQTNFEDRF